MKTEERLPIPGPLHPDLFEVDTPIMALGPEETANGEPRLGLAGITRVSGCRCRGDAVITIHRPTRLRRYRVSLRRYRALRTQTMCMGAPTDRSGHWLWHGFVVVFRAGTETKR